MELLITHSLFDVLVAVLLDGMRSVAAVGNGGGWCWVLLVFTVSCVLLPRSVHWPRRSTKFAEEPDALI